MSTDRPTDRSHRTGGRARGGMTLVEAVISLLIVAVMMVAALQTIGTTARHRQAQASMRRGPALARNLISEILPNRYVDTDASPLFGPESGETVGGTRAAFNDVDDYHGWSESTIQAKDGMALSDLAGWSRSVVVQYVSGDNLDTPVGSDTGLKRITVTVTDPQGRKTTVSALRSRAGVYDHPPSVETTYLSSVSVEVQLGQDVNVRVVSAANPLNRIPVQ